MLETGRVVKEHKLPGQWWCHHSLQCSKGLQMWHLGHGLGVNTTVLGLILKVFSNQSNFMTLLLSEPGNTWLSEEVWNSLLNS